MDRLRNAADYVSLRIKTSVIPVIMCNQDCRGSYQTAKNANVHIIDLNKIEQLSKMVLDGKVEGASQLFHALLSIE